MGVGVSNPKQVRKFLFSNMKSCQELLPFFLSLDCWSCILYCFDLCGSLKELVNTVAGRMSSALAL